MTEPGVGSGTRAGTRWHGAVPPLLTAAGVFGVLVVQQILLGLVDLSFALGMPDPAQTAGQLGSGLLSAVLIYSLPLSLGVFVSLWQLAPITRESNLAQVVLRGLLATAIGALLVVVLVVIAGFIGALAGVTFFGASFPDLGGPFRQAGFAVLGGVTGAGREFILGAPVVVLAALLLWGRLRQSEPDDRTGPPMREV